MKRKRVELTDEIVRCARAVRAVHLAGEDIGRYHESLLDLMAAVDALDAYGPAEIVGGHGAFNPDSETSQISAYLMAPHTGSIRRLVVDEIAVGMWQANGELHGLTCAELCGRMHRKHQTVSSAVNWAENAGWIMDSGYRRDATPGHPATVYCLTPAALAKRGER